MKHILFDLDGTLVVNLDFTLPEELNTYPPENLTATSDKILGASFALLKQDEMAKIFKSILTKDNLRLGFLTASIYPKEEVILLLEKAYKLPGNILSSCFYCNRNHAPKGANKGSIMSHFYFQEIISKDSILVDDLLFQLEDAKLFGFNTIHADSRNHNPSYIQAIQTAISSNIENSPKKPILFQQDLLKTKENADVVPEEVTTQLMPQRKFPVIGMAHLFYKLSR